MKSDGHFHEIFSARPDWLYELLGLPVPEHCKFTSPVLKTVQRQLDGFLTGEGEPPRVVEVQMQHDDHIYFRTGMEWAQVAMQPGHAHARAIIVFGTKSLDPRTPLWCDFIPVVYLDEALERLRTERPEHPLVSVLFPFMEADNAILATEAPVHYRRIQSHGGSPAEIAVLLRVLLDFLLQRLPNLNHHKIAMMLNFPPLEETEG